MLGQVCATEPSLIVQPEATGHAVHLLVDPVRSMSLQKAEGCKAALQRYLQQGSSWPLAGQAVGLAPTGAHDVDVLLIDDVLLFVDEVLFVDVLLADVTRQEQAEERRERELAQGPERAVGVGEGALEGEEVNLKSVVAFKKQEKIGKGTNKKLREDYGVANCFVQKAMSLLL